MYEVAWRSPQFGGRLGTYHALEYDLSRRATMRFDLASQVVSDPRSAERTLWEGARVRDQGGPRGSAVGDVTPRP
jgi:hypothetical protein